MNRVLSRKDEQQRRWKVGLESLKIGLGRNKLPAQITCLHGETRSRGREELGKELEDRPPARVRREGGGRPPVEKWTPPSNRT
jgi:hypothetical protein